MYVVRGGKGKQNLEPKTIFDNLKVAVNRGTQAKRSWLRNEREIEQKDSTRAGDKEELEQTNPAALLHPARKRTGYVSKSGGQWKIARLRLAWNPSEDFYAGRVVNVRKEKQK